MDLGNFFKRQGSNLPEHYWSLVIGKTWVEAGIWRVVGGKTEVVAEGGGASWQEDDEKTLAAAADSTLSAAAARIEKEDVVEPTKVVFGLPPSWTEEGNIKKEKLGLLKKLSQELELSPAGFVVIPEAIVYYLKTKEGAPPNIVLVGVFESEIDVSLVQNGKIQKTVEVARSMSLSADLAEGLARFTGNEQHPSRIVLYNHKVSDLEEAKQNLLSADWKEAGISFLHTPKVEILDEDIAVPAVSLAGGAEVGRATDVQTQDEQAQEEQEEIVEEAEKPVEELTEVNPADLGFSPAQPQEPEPRAANYLTGVKSFWESVRLPQISFPRFRGGRSVASIVFVIIFFLLVGSSLAYWYLPKANVTIYVAPKRLEKEIELVVDGQVVEGTVSGEKTTQATGTKTVGDRAAGKVTVYRTGPSLVLPAGTTLTSQNGLKFTLNEQTQVASGSAVKRGEVGAPVTATDIGAQYNLAGGTTFSVGNFSESDLGAENKEAFSGGSSREITAVSEEDRKGLEEDLSEELEARALEQIKNRLGENELLVGSTAEFTAKTRNFSHKVGEEASTLKLNLEGGVKALVVPKNELNSFLMSKLESEVSQGYLLRPEQIQVEFKEGEDEGEFKVQVVANLLPQVNPDEIARSVAGKYPDVAKSYLSSIPGFTRAQIDLSVRLPGKLRTLPRIAKNIQVEVSAER